MKTKFGDHSSALSTAHMRADHPEGVDSRALCLNESSEICGFGRSGRRRRCLRYGSRGIPAGVQGDRRDDDEHAGTREPGLGSSHPTRMPWGGRLLMPGMTPVISESDN